MRLRNITGSEEVIAASPYVVQNPKEVKGRWKEYWNNEKELHIEIGMGKGRFMMGMAKEHSDINYIGIEKYSSVLLRAVQKNGTGRIVKFKIYFNGCKRNNGCFWKR